MHSAGCFARTCHIKAEAATAVGWRAQARGSASPRAGPVAVRDVDEHTAPHQQQHGRPLGRAVPQQYRVRGFGHDHRLLLKDGCQDVEAVTRRWHAVGVRRDVNAHFADFGDEEAVMKAAVQLQAELPVPPERLGQSIAQVRQERWHQCGSDVCLLSKQPVVVRHAGVYYQKADDALTP